MPCDTTPSAGREPAPAMHIGEVAVRTELSLRTLRYYDEIGLLRPSGRTVGGFRLYAEGDVEKLLVIRRMKPLGFSLDQMSAAMQDLEILHRDSHDDPKAAARHRLAGILSEANDRRAALAHQLGMADEFIDLLGGQLA